MKGIPTGFWLRNIAGYIHRNELDQKPVGVYGIV